MIEEEEEKKRPIPKKFRASLDMSDTEAFALLEKADEQQKEWAEQFNTPLDDGSSGAKHRAKAVITIKSLIGQKNRTPDQIEILAEAYATIGRYDLAAELSILNKDLYAKYWVAVFLDDAEWCAHPAQHKYIKEYVFSIRESKEVPLLACNICRTWNVADAPDHLIEDQQRRAKVRQDTKGMSMGEVKGFLVTNFPKK